MKERQRVAGLILAIMMLFSLLASAVSAGSMDPPSTTFGQVIDQRQTELAPGATYTWYDMKTSGGTQKAHFVTFNPQNSNLDLIAGTKSGKVRGMEGVTQMAAYADAPGNRVIAGINGDFFEISGNATGVPNGLFMGDGRILNSSTTSFAFGLRADGTSIYGTPMLTKTISIDGSVTPITHINRFRSDNQLVLYTNDYYTSTMTSNEGDEVVLNIISGEVKHAVPLQLQVAEVRAGQGNTPLQAGQVVLSASGNMRSVLAGLQPGDEVTAEFTLSDGWGDVEVAIGGTGPLIKDGIVQNGVGPAGIHPRTAIGTKADGSIVLFEIDGRQPGFSEGVETEELAAIMADLGVVQAMNLDGGGSSTMVAKLPGETAYRVMNSPSDGGERKTGNGLLLVNKAPELGTPAALAVEPNAERVLAGTSIVLQAKGVDANGHPAAITGTPAWAADASIGGVDAGGVFTAGDQAGKGVITVQADSVQGTAEIEVVDRLTAIEFPDEAKTYESGMSETLSVVATRDGQVIQADNSSFEWRVEGEIGTIDENGVFTATDENGKSGRIIAAFGDLEASMNVSVGIPPVILEDFESGLDRYFAGGAAYNTVSIEEETNPDFVRSGSTSLKLSYDFTGKTGTSGAYLQTSAANKIIVPGYPQKISMWVYGDGKAHWLRMQMRDGNNAAIPLDFTPQTTGVNWKGWRYIEAVVPTGKTTPFTIDMPVRYMETSNGKKDAGAIYVDDIRALYGSVEEDIAPPIIRSIAPAENTTVKNAHPTISATAEDEGYDPVQHPATTLINPESIRVYLDDQLVQHGLYPPKGTITYTPTEPLAEGRHKAKIAVRDMSGNQTIKEWYFNVNLGSPLFLNETPTEQFAGATYDMTIKAEKAALLKGGHVEYRFDKDVTQSFEVIRGPKLNETQLTSTVDEAQGMVTITFADLESASLTDSDVLAQIRYTVKSDAIGPLGLEQSKGGEAARDHTIEFQSGSIVLTDGTTKPTYGAPITSTVKNKLKLLWNHYSIALGQPASFTITENGEAVEGASLLLNGTEAPEASSDASGILTTTNVTQAMGTFTVQAKKGDAYSPVITFPVAAFTGTPAPLNISVSVGENASTSRHLTWHTHPDTTATVVEWAPKEQFTDFGADNVTRTEGESSLYNSNNDGTYRVHKAELTGLEPDTAYVYRVGDGAGQVSGQGEFRTTAAGGDSLKLLFFGDSQAADQAGFAQWGTALAKAVEDMPDAELLIHAGDMVDHGYEQEQWNYWFAAAQDIFMKYTLQTVVGNHEVMGTNGNGDYLAHFHNPQNGADVAKGSSYSFDMKDTHFVMLNTEMSEEALIEQGEWLDQDLSASNKKWKVIVFHQGPYGSIYTNTQVQEHWVPIFDKHKVDLVLNGHDHVYLRTFPMKGGEIVEAGEGTRYVIGGSTGPKFYALTERYWQELVFDEEVNVYTSVEFEGDTITITAKTVAGETVDTFDIVKKDRPVTPPPGPFPTPTPAPGGDPTRVEVKPEQLKGNEGGEDIVIRVDESMQELVLPGNAAELAGKSDVVIQTGDYELALSSEWLKEIAAKLPEEQREDGRITLGIEQLARPEANNLLKKAEEQTGAKLKQAGEIWSFSLVITDAGGKEQTVSRFEEPLSISMKTSAQTAKKVAGFYYISDDGELTYMGGEWEDGWLTADIPHFSYYAVLEYRKSFQDVAADHWAADAILELSAKHIAQGVTAALFAPEERITRAEFAALLVRALGVEGEAETGFQDVPAEAWYAREVSLAAQAGIVTGKGNGVFEPEAEVTRQEMAAMIVRAYAYATGEEQAASGEAPYADIDAAPDWAKQAVALSHELGFMQGYPNQQFKPEGFGTRAQSAKLIHSLISNIDEM